MELTLVTLAFQDATAEQCREFTAAAGRGRLAEAGPMEAPSMFPDHLMRGSIRTVARIIYIYISADM